MSPQLFFMCMSATSVAVSHVLFTGLTGVLSGARKRCAPIIGIILLLPLGTKVTRLLLLLLAQGVVVAVVFRGFLVEKRFCLRFLRRCITRTGVARCCAITMIMLIVIGVGARGGRGLLVAGPAGKECWKEDLISPCGRRNIVLCCRSKRQTTNSYYGSSSCSGRTTTTGTAAAAAVLFWNQAPNQRCFRPVPLHDKNL